MEIQKKKRSRKKLIVICVVVLLLVGAGSAYAYFATDLLKSDPVDQTQDTNQRPDETVAEEDDDDTDDSRQNDDQPVNDDVDYVRPDITNPPTNTSPYPIENERYRIEQRSERSYAVELYPIINNPEYSDYDAQLRDYKNEVLRYLQSRYGNIDNFNITWIPEDAANL